MKMNKKNCDLCGNSRAIMYCESDEANLCWDCDSKVHSANFLVAKHSRNLLCNSCRNQTPWTASGPKLSPTFSLCNSCIENPTEEIGDNDEEENYQTETDDDDDEDEDEFENSDSEIDDDDDGNQVVPLSSSSPPSSSTFFSPSPARSVSSTGSFGDLSAAGDGGATAAAVASSPWKRVRESDCLPSEDEENKGTSSSIGLLRPMKVLRTNELCE